MLIFPSLLVLGVFVYGLIAWSFAVSLSDRHTAMGTDNFVGLDNYQTLVFNDINNRFLHSLKNLLIFTIAFMTGTMLLGVTLAVLLERGVRGEGIFRTIYLFPMAISFIASGVIWRWLLNSRTGPDSGGLNWIFWKLGLGFLQNQWWTNPRWGMAAMAIPAVWQLSGYVMALFLTGFRGIPPELREASIVDGASTYQLYRYVIFPQLTPVALTALIIMGHMSMKVFDLIMSVSGAQWLTEVPAVYVWQALLTSDYAKACTISIILLVSVAAVIVPYLVRGIRMERR